MAEKGVMSFVTQNIRIVIDEENSDSLSSGVKSEAQALNRELMKLEKELVERNGPGLNNNEQVRARFSELRKIVYDAEDVVDKFVSKTESSAFSSLTLIRRSFKDAKKLRGLQDQIKAMVATIEEQGGSPSKKNPTTSLGNEPSVRQAHPQVKAMVATTKDQGSSTNKNATTSLGHEPAVQQAHRHADNDFVVGVEADVRRLVDRILDENSPVNVLTIVGMGGSGKSTLARKMYSEKVVTDYFKYQAWVSLSKEWSASQEEHLLSEILSKMGKGKMPEINQQERLDMVKELLEKERCLIVLDDVWDWDYLQKMVEKLLGSGVSKSKIVITSRQFLPSPDRELEWGFHETKLLSDQDSLTLFNKVSSSCGGKDLGREYQGLAIDMLKKCKGLPLAIVALGRLLKKKDTVEEWERVFSRLNGEEGPYLYGPVTDILALSYYELPHHLKPFFLYLGLLLGESISAATLKRMWIAEGFIKTIEKRENETSEEAATRILQELVNHTMVQPVTFTYTGKVKTIRVHNLMRDVCVKIAQELDFFTLPSSHSDHSHSRRAAVDLSKGSAFPYNNPSLRSLLVFGKSSTGLGIDKQSDTIVNQQGILKITTVFEKLKLLRVLDIKGIKINDGIMPKEIGNLIHLRYLRIRSTNIRKLPKSIGKLHKLLTLDYWDVSGDKEIRLPNVFWKLEKLTHLFLPNEMMSTTRADFELDTLKELQTLWGVKGGDWMLKEMETLSTSLTKLHIQGISSKEQLEAVIHCPAIKTLRALVLDWYGFLASDFIDKLCSYEGLEIRRLKLLGRAPDKFKALTTFPSNLGKLELYYTHLDQEETMDALGKLSNLKFLGLAKDSFIGSKWACKENKFASLEELNLTDLPNLENWMMEKGTMSCLKKLSIISCAKLQQVPEGLKSLQKLETFEVRRMPTNFNSRLRQKKETDDTSKGGEDFEIVQNIPNVTILDSCKSFTF